MAHHESPIFLLGTGRCGSTYWQKLLCNTEDIWIWGEHDGILMSFNSLIHAFRPSSALSKWSLTRETIMSTSDITQGDATLFAWNNGFTQELAVNLARDFITCLFTANLPAEKKRWGFKEIRYGISDEIPDFLLTLFPKGRVIVTARDPVETVISTLSAWHFAEIQKFVDGEDSRLPSLVTSYIERWIGFSKNMEILKQVHPDQVCAVYLGDPIPVEALSSFLGVDFSCHRNPEELKPVNQNLTNRRGRDNPALVDLIQATLEPNRSEVERLTSLFRRNFS